MGARVRALFFEHERASLPAQTSTHDGCSERELTDSAIILMSVSQALPISVTLVAAGSLHSRVQQGL